MCRSPCGVSTAANCCRILSLLLVNAFFPCLYELLQTLLLAFKPPGIKLLFHKAPLARKVARYRTRCSTFFVGIAPLLLLLYLVCIKVPTERERVVYATSGGRSRLVAVRNRCTIEPFNTSLSFLSVLHVPSTRCRDLRSTTFRVAFLLYNTKNLHSVCTER